MDSRRADPDRSLRPDNAGLFGGILNAAAQIGTAVGIAVLLAGVSIGAGPAPGTPDASARGQLVAYLIAGVFALLTAALVALLARRWSDGAAGWPASPARPEHAQAP
ncbi:hypothetical protein AB0875_05025 [Micromonospora gifhornensis]|uniref:hypothetical protein n=1 Tax=Micromonospora gifhornensis TaxID=84594 RepID=UPI0034546D5D